MKSSTLLLLLLTGCAAPRSAKIGVTPRPMPQRPEPTASAVRYPEVINGYQIGRYVDPQDSLVMHEGHRFYRVESMGTWELHSASSDLASASGAASRTNAAFAPLPVSDEVTAEINRQRELTRSFSQQSHALSESLAQLREALAATRAFANQSRLTRQQLADALRRLTTLEHPPKQNDPNAPTHDEKP